MNATLTAIANDWGYPYVFSKQVEGLGQAGDILIGISTSGNSENVLRAIEVAKKMGIITVVLTGQNRGPYRVPLTEKPPLVVVPNFVISVPSEYTAFVQQAHIKILHYLVSAFDYKAFGVDYFDRSTWK